MKKKSYGMWKEAKKKTSTERSGTRDKDKMYTY